MYADIIVDVTSEKVDKVFQYRIPEELKGAVTIGSEVVVPFGKGDRQIHGYVVSFSEKTTYDPDKIKSIAALVNGQGDVRSRLVKLADWMRTQYGGTMIQALKTVLPMQTSARAREERWVRLCLDEAAGKEQLAAYQRRHETARARVLSALLATPVMAYGDCLKTCQVSRPVLTAMEAQQVLTIQSRQVDRNPVPNGEQVDTKVAYTQEQRAAIDTFWQDYAQGKRDTYLLYGVTGSGKTEVYLEMIERVVAKGYQAIMLIPEIALTYQTVRRFYARFGDRVTILNSRLSKGERSDQIRRVKNGEVDVMIGPRSALFTPFARLGLIVIDEEHENTYKSETVPRYHARETAIKRAQLEGASVVLGSATPSLEAYSRALSKEYTLLRLSKRVTGQGLADVCTVDMRAESRKGNRSLLSTCLHDQIADRLDKGQQIMLFLNRRGYAGFVSCRDCGYVVKCPHCDVSLSVHKGGRLVCHYCGYEIPVMDRCPSCGSGHLGNFQAGTQQVEDLVRAQFPQAKVLRMDLDTTRGKTSHEEILSAFSRGEADILIGTQMIVKGHDFPGVTLVGILDADLSLYADDYRAAERTFQLLTQAAGRAGRGREKGQVVIQTYSPDHYAVAMAARQDYEGFYQEEMSYRTLMGYPPVEQLLAVLVSGREEALLDTAMGYLAQMAQKADTKRYLAVIGPTAPYVGKVKDVYRRILYLKCEETGYLLHIKDLLEAYVQMNRGFDPLSVQFDFNPMNTF